MRFDNSWTLFLDRDGVINEREDGGYIAKPEDFSFVPGTIKAMEKLNNVFGRIVIVTNQAGIGKGIMTEKQLQKVHAHMMKTFDLLDGRVDKIYYCPDKPDSNSPNRKPETGMAMQAKADFPEIDFSRSVIVGDSLSDMAFGAKLGMVKVFIEGKGEDPSVQKPDFQYASLKDFADAIPK
jgi:D-glycero-D-manno-heptose 1,7-bisphosphate phosphatase